MRVATLGELQTALAHQACDLLIAHQQLASSEPAAAVLAHVSDPGIPVILLTGASQETGEHAPTQGVVESVYVDDLNQLASAVVQAVGQREQSDPSAAPPSPAGRQGFISRISHDLRTPLSAIKASIGVVLAHEPPNTPEPLHRLYKNIDLAADRMSELIANLTELARIQIGQFVLNLEECDLADVARQAARAVEPWLQRRDQRLILEVPDAGVPVVVDAGRMQLCLLNLLSNAQKYGQEGGTVRLQLRSTADAAHLVVSGDGRPASDLDRASIRAALHLDPGSEVQSHGLGLAIAWAIVEQHGGRIWADTPPNAGVVFHVSLPSPTAPDVSSGSGSPR